MVIQTGFGDGGRGGRASFVPSASPFADNTARDTWAAANLDELFNSDTQVTVITVAGEAFEWAGGNEPSSYNANGWQPRSRLPSAAEVKILYESNPDTNAFQDAEKGEVNALEAIPDGSFPIKSGEIFVGRTKSK